MKQLFKNALLLVLSLLVNPLYSQWTYKEMSNPVYGKYKVAYTPVIGNMYLKLFERGEGQVGLVINTGHTCESFPNVEMSFQMDTGWCSFSIIGLTSEDSKMVFLISDVENDIYDWFTESKNLMVKIDDKSCGIDIRTFSMVNSESALKFMIE